MPLDRLRLTLAMQLDPRKQVHVSCRCSTDGEVSVTVQDEGEGFDRDALLDPADPWNRLLTSDVKFASCDF